MIPPIPIANRPSTARYRAWLSNTARATPGSLSEHGRMAGREMAAPRKNDGNVTISPTIRTSTAKTSALAASIGVRRGTASSDARMTPVEYSLVMTSTPRTQMVSWPNSSPDPKDRAHRVGHDRRTRCGIAPSHWRMVSQVNRPVKPKVSTTSRTSVLDGRAHRPDLRPLREHQATESCDAGHGRGAGRCRAGWPAPAGWRRSPGPPLSCGRRSACDSRAGRLVRGSRRLGARIQAAGGQLHVRLLQRRPLRGEFVQHDATRGGQLADPGAQGAREGSAPAVGAVSRPACRLPRRSDGQGGRVAGSAPAPYSPSSAR